MQPTSTTVQLDTYTYSIDTNDQLISFSANWDGFACANESRHLQASHIKEHSLWEFISNRETVALYRELLTCLRDRGTSAGFHYRCDSPDLRRFMHMDISADEQGFVTFVSQVVRTEPRATIEVLLPDAERSEELLVMCGWCKKVRVDSTWVEIEAALEPLQLMDRWPLPAISHGICEQCAEAMERQIEAIQ
ncbi:hypothetical protein GF356_00175 [candidate division GN15 bacterium]|nr:hypothetical protein [candidate division GN15 bacterium]